MSPSLSYFMIPVLSSCGQECFFHGCSGKLALPLISGSDFFALRCLSCITQEIILNKPFTALCLCLKHSLLQQLCWPVLVFPSWKAWCELSVGLRAAMRMFSLQDTCLQDFSAVVWVAFKFVWWSLLALWRSELQKEGGRKGSELYKWKIILFCFGADRGLQDRLLN